MGQAPPAADVVGYMDKLSNWGRWGEQDTLGTLNLVTPAKRQQAASLIREGAGVSCSRVIPHLGTGAMLGQGGPQSYMIQSGEKYALGGPDNDPHALQFAAETLSYIFHGFAFTHIDDFSHVFVEGKMYNGRSAGLVTSSGGAQEQNVEALRDGVFTRGVLLDLARLRGVDVLDPEDQAYPEDLEACEEAQGVRVEEGDVILLRTGYQGQLDRLEPGAEAPHGHSGWAAACLPWFHERGVALIGADVINDAIPTGYDASDSKGITALPVHAVALVAMGLRLIDNAHLERVSEACAERNRWEFALSLNPLRFERGTGSPVNPVAMF
jgi:kynurenine formamidase